jgi:RNA polymerase sigma factor (TIGR02999 family)
MRQILIEHARSHSAMKRGGGAGKITLEETQALQEQTSIDIIALDGALDRLTAMDAQQGKIVELRFFGGLTIEDTSEVLGISPATVKRDWVTARAWLHREITGSKAE